MDWTDTWWGLILVAIAAIAAMIIGVFLILAFFGAFIGIIFAGLAWGFCLFVTFC